MDNTKTLLLRRALQGNACFSTATGLALALAGGWLGPILGVPALVLHAIGGMLVLFALALLKNAARPEVHRTEAWIVVALDLSWVLGSVALVTLDLWPLTSTGMWVILAVADFVLLFAGLQTWGLLRARCHGPVPELRTH
ncbi:MAG: hypothetical protein P1V35_18080 [Planctomycetota bacterium]|nr:hypothetical protein [Planctomycetota bacterium]